MRCGLACAARLLCALPKAPSDKTKEPHKETSSLAATPSSGSCPPPLSPARIVGQALSTLRALPAVRRLSKARDAARAKIDAIRSALEATSGGRGLSDGGDRLREQLRAADASLAELDAQAAAAARVQSHRVDAGSDVDALVARVNDLSVGAAPSARTASEGATCAAAPNGAAVAADSLADSMGGLTVAGARAGSATGGAPPRRGSGAGGPENSNHTSNGGTPPSGHAESGAACVSAGGSSDGTAGEKVGTAQMSNADERFVQRMKLKQKIAALEVLPALRVPCSAAGVCSGRYCGSGCC